MKKSLVTLSLTVLLTGCASQTLPASEPATVATVDPVTTQTATTLADDIAKRLASICSQEELKKIEVTTVDAIARKPASKRNITIK